MMSYYELNDVLGLLVAVVFESCLLCLDLSVIWTITALLSHLQNTQVLLATSTGPVELICE
jgi:hypothetical protein